MIYPNEAFYVVGGGFGLGIGGEFSSFGFSIGMDSKFAERFYKREITEEESNNINLYGKGLIKNIFDYKHSLIDNPYHFLRNENEKQTLLLQWCRVPGDACDLGIDGMDLHRVKEFREDWMVEYAPHNVDTLQKAFGLFTIWNEWATSAYALTNDD